MNELHALVIAAGSFFPRPALQEGQSKGSHTEKHPRS